MEVIAVNAAIAASKSQVNREAYSVLASEVGRIARLVGATFHHLKEAGEDQARYALLGVEKARRLEVYERALVRLGAGENHQPVAELVATLCDQVHEHVRGLRQYLADLEEQLRDVDRQSNRIGTIATTFRIEASRDDRLGDQFRYISDSLTESHQEIRTVTQDVRGTLSRKDRPRERRAA